VAWMILAGINSGMGYEEFCPSIDYNTFWLLQSRNTATLITNQPDYARWSRSRGAPVWTQVVSNTILSTIQSLSIGI
jgi:NCS1 family nucleobase:cation symporter-1